MVWRSTGIICHFQDTGGELSTKQVLNGGSQALPKGVSLHTVNAYISGERKEWASVVHPLYFSLFLIHLLTLISSIFLRAPGKEKNLSLALSPLGTSLLR